MKRRVKTRPTSFALTRVRPLAGLASRLNSQPQHSSHLRMPTRSVNAASPDHFTGCLLGGAVGDALGAAVELLSQEQIRDRFGAQGISEFAEMYGRLGAITDDTQMSLFTAEGLLRGYVRLRHRGITTYSGVTANAYQRWLRTQGETAGCELGARDESGGWLIGHRQLHQRRGPGDTCLSALQAMSSLGDPATNNSKGCGGVMRMAPVGLFAARASGGGAKGCFDLGCELAALTHGHPTGFLAAGAFAVLILGLITGNTLPQSLQLAKDLLSARPDHQETLQALERAERLSKHAVQPPQAIAQLGQGWVAEEALAIAVYSALVAQDFRHGVCLAVNHSGDSDSTGAITGNLLGAQLGRAAIPGSWLEPLELRGVIEEIACDLFEFPTWEIGEYSQNPEQDRQVWAKYPGF